MVQIRRRELRPKKNGEVSTSWQVDFVDAGGVRRRVSKPTRRAAEEFRDEVLLSLREGTGATLSGRSFAAAAEDYLKIVEKVGRGGRPPVEPEVALQYRRALEMHVLPRVGSMVIADIKGPDVVAFRDWLVLESGLSAGSARKAFLHYRGVLQEELVRGGLRANVWSGISMPTGRARRATQAHDLGLVAGEIPSRTEIAALIRTAEALRTDPRPFLSAHRIDANWQKYSKTDGPRGHRAVQSAWEKYYVLLLTAVLTGMRQGEIRALHWHSVDLASGVIHVKASATAAGRIKAPKSQAGFRQIDIPDSLIEELAAWRRLCPAGDLVFPTATGAVLRKENLYRRMWQRLLAYAGVRHVTFHALRHHYASLLIAGGATAKEVKVALGHADIQTTFNIYGHLFPEDRGARRARISGISDALLTAAQTPAAAVGCHKSGTGNR